MVKWHMIEGEAGCAYAVAHRCVAIVVDALRASATAAMMLDAGATEILVVREVAEAFQAKKSMPDALLFGERGGLPPDGFDFGNSPRTMAAAAGRRVVFTTTTGAQRLVSAWGAHAVYMGTTINASAVAEAARQHGADVVLIPAGFASDPSFNAQEDWVATSVIAMQADAVVEHGAERYAYWRALVETEGVKALFETAPHADKLRAAGLEADVGYCAQVDVTTTVPQAVARETLGVVLRNRISMWPVTTSRSDSTRKAP